MVTNYDKIKPKQTKVSSGDDSKPKNQVIAKGHVAKPNLAVRTGRLFFGEEGFKGFTSHLVHEVVVPNLQNLVADTIIDGVQRAIFGDVYYDRRHTRGRRSNVRYLDDYRGRGRVTRYDDMYDDRPTRKRTTTRSDRVMRIEYTDYDDAKNVLNQMIDTVDTFQIVPVADYYELSDVPSKFTDHSWGWDNLDSARIVATRNGRWIIELPPVIQI